MQQVNEIVNLPEKTKVEFTGRVVNVYPAKEKPTQYSNMVQNLIVEGGGQKVKIAYWFKKEKNSPFVPDVVGKMVKVKGSMTDSFNGIRNLNASSVDVIEPKQEEFDEIPMGDVKQMGNAKQIEEKSSYKRITLADVCLVANNALAFVKNVMAVVDEQAQVNYVNTCVIAYTNGKFDYSPAPVQEKANVSADVVTNEDADDVPVEFRS